MNKDEILAALWSDFEYNFDQDSVNYDFAPLTSVRYKDITEITEGHLVDRRSNKVYRMVLEEIPETSLTPKEKKEFDDLAESWKAANN